MNAILPGALAGRFMRVLTHSWMRSGLVAQSGMAVVVTPMIRGSSLRVAAHLLAFSSTIFTVAGEKGSGKLFLMGQFSMIAGLNVAT